jgi:hypothetical protein
MSLELGVEMKAIKNEIEQINRLILHSFTP